MVVISTSPIWCGVSTFVWLEWYITYKFYLLPSFASLSASSLPIIFVWALTLYRWVVVVRFLSMFTIDASIVLSG
jgi:hypothetical protein